AKPPPLPPAARASASGSKPPPLPRHPEADSLGATEPHLPRYDSVGASDPVSRATELDPTDPVPRDTGSLPPVAATPPRSRSLDELAGIPPPGWAQAPGDLAAAPTSRRRRRAMPSELAAGSAGAEASADPAGSP